MARPVDLVLRLKADTDAAASDINKLSGDLQAADDAAADLGSELDDVSGTRVKIDLNNEAIDKARQDVERLQGNLREQVRLGLDTGPTLREIGKVERAIKAIEKENVKLDVQVDTTSVDRSMKRAGRSTGEFKDEAKQNLSEVASSFSGSMTSAADLIQGTLGGIVSAMGPVGAAIGVAGAVGVGLFVAQLQKAKERADELFDAIVEGGGKVNTTFTNNKLQDMAKDGTLTKIKKNADLLGVSFDTLAQAYAGSQDALSQVLPALQKQNAALHAQGGQFESTGAAVNAYAGASQQVTADLSDQSGVTADATTQASLYAQATQGATVASESAAAAAERHTEAQSTLNDSLGGFTDAASIYSTLLSDKQAAEQASAQATADATKDQKDSWQDYAKSVGVSVDEYLVQLAKQVTAQETWAANMQTLAKRGVDEGVLAELAKMGPEAAPLIQQLATASDKKLGEMVTLFHRKGQASGSGFADGLASTEQAAANATSVLLAGINSTIANTKIQGVEIPISGNTDSFYLALNSARKRAAEAVATP